MLALLTEAKPLELHHFGESALKYRYNVCNMFPASSATLYQNKWLASNYKLFDLV